MKKIIALVGNPGSGKNEVANILCRVHGYKLIDDSYWLKSIASRKYNIPVDWFYDRRYKDEAISDLAGKSPRQLAGELGNEIESLIDPVVFAKLAYSEMPESGLYVVPSVRQTQPDFWKSVDATLIEVVRSEAIDPGNNFDWYNAERVDFRIHNEGTLKDLENSVASVLRDATHTKIHANNL